MTEENGKEKTEEQEEKSIFSFFLPEGGISETGSDTKSRTVGLYGDVDEEVASAIVYSLLTLKTNGEIKELKDPEDKNSEIVTTYMPIKMIVSTHGGSAHEMFAIYDIMRMIKKNYDIETIGIGKVMSAGVLLLAAGTKGKRKIGKNCRVMLHPVSAASMGDINDLENDTQEIKRLQKQYLEGLIENTSMAERHIKKLFKKKTNTYLSAKEALECGIVDEIF